MALSRVSGWVVVLAVVGGGAGVAGGCSASGGTPSGGQGGAGGSAAVGGTAGSAATGATGGSGGTGGSTGGTGGTISLDGGDDASDAALTDGPGNTNDAALDVVGDVCSDAGAVPGPQARLCAQATGDECDGSSDVSAALPNGTTGNGFDDDCDGRVDEGCECPPGVGSGQTKVCYAVSPTQADGAGQPVGWCRQNSVGTVRCVTEGTGEFIQGKWDGECRGAQLPFGDDVCAPGDFDCDGLDANSRTADCSCGNAPVQCPTDPIVTAPFPPQNSLPFIEGRNWITDVSLQGQASNWKWTATGGDCDNILPHPSFQLFNGPNGLAVPPGVQATGLGPAADQTGIVIDLAHGANSRVYPAFALSGDYLVTGEWDLQGRRYSCTVKVQVRAPGIRAELCWTPMPNDVDLHFARLQGATCDGPGHGWFQTCRTDEAADDCYYQSSSGCPGFSSNPSAWGYAQSAFSACHGWGSRRDATAGCDNPRLDFDNISCTVTQRNPGGVLFAGSNDFCGAENINLDNPKDGERFAIGAHAFSFTNNPTVKPHLNIYCNGERRLSLGYQPGTQDFPHFTRSGGGLGGDFWSAAVVEAVVDARGELTDCLIDTVPSAVPRPDRDGSNALCVDTNPQNATQPATDNRQWLFTAGGGYPAAPADMCWH